MPDLHGCVESDMKGQGILRLLVMAMASLLPIVRSQLVVACAIVVAACFLAGKRQIASPNDSFDGPFGDRARILLGFAVIVGIAWLVAVTLPPLIPQVSRSVIQSTIALVAASQVGIVLAKISTSAQVESPAPSDFIPTAWGTDLNRHSTDEALSEVLLIAIRGDYPTAITALEKYRNQRNLDPETTSSLDRMLAIWQSLAQDGMAPASARKKRSRFAP